MSSSYDAAAGSNVVYIVNRSLTEDAPLTIHWQNRKPTSVKAVYQLAGTDPKAANSFENPNAVVTKTIAAPAVRDGESQLVLPPLSFTVLECTL